MAVEVASPAIILYTAEDIVIVLLAYDNVTLVPLVNPILELSSPGNRSVPSTAIGLYT